MDVEASEIAQRQLGRVDGATEVDIENDQRGRFKLVLLVKSVDKNVLGDLSNPGIRDDDVYPPILLSCFLEDVELVVPVENRTVDELNISKQMSISHVAERLGEHIPS
jgi:hypothetical protein